MCVFLHNEGSSKELAADIAYRRTAGKRTVSAPAGGRLETWSHTVKPCLTRCWDSCTMRGLYPALCNCLTLRLDSRTLNTCASTWWLVLIYMVVDLLSFEVDQEAPCKSPKHLVNIVYMAFANKHHVKQSTWGGTLSPMCLGFTWRLCLGSF